MAVTRKIAGAANAALVLPVGAVVEERPELTIAVDNLWPTIDLVIGITTTGARMHSNQFHTLDPTLRSET